jgi:site-specific DNA-methyltransferase (adenine-specific)
MGRYSVCDVFDDDSGNIRFERTEHEWKDGKCVYCGANQENYDRGGELETHAYEFIHVELRMDTDKARIDTDIGSANDANKRELEGVFSMKFDVIVGNPPYQLSTGGSGRQAKPIYQYFVQQAKKMNPRYLTMIIPDRWFAGGMGLGDFRKEMLEDKQMRKLVDYANSKDCFPGPDIPGGICYFLWEKGATGDCKVTNIYQGNSVTSLRKLDEFETFIRFEPAVKILRKIIKINESKMTDIISGVRPFGIPTKARPEKKGDLFLISSGGSGNIASSIVTSGQDMINKWKVMTSKTSHDHAGQADNEGKRRVLSRVEILPPKYVCTESYIILGSFETKVEAENCMRYVTSYFVRFLVSLLSFSQDITRERFSFVPMQDFSEPWTDEKLYEKYGLTQDEIAFIESMIRPMEIREGENV